MPNSHWLTKVAQGALRSSSPQPVKMSMQLLYLCLFLCGFFKTPVDFKLLCCSLINFIFENCCIPDLPALCRRKKHWRSIRCDLGPVLSNDQTCRFLWRRPCESLQRCVQGRGKGRQCTTCRQCRSTISRAVQICVWYTKTNKQTINNNKRHRMNETR